MATDKMTSRTRSIMDESRQNGEQIPIIVKFHSLSSKQAFHYRASISSVRSLRKDFHLIPATAMTVEADEVENLVAREEVAEVWYDEPVRVLLDTSVPSMGVPEVWQTTGVQGEGVTLCIIDTGIDTAHPDFRGRITRTADFTGLGSVEDSHGHGTHVASIATGSGQASSGRYQGIAPQANIMAARVLDHRGDGRMSNVMAGLEWAADNGAQIMILSLGTNDTSGGMDALCDMVNAVVAMSRIVVVAAGNDGPRDGTIGSPAAAAGALTVGATLDAARMAQFSSRGPTSDGRVKPEIVAPGHNIIAARASGTSFGSPVDAHYTQSMGTSMAAPHAAGVCALILGVNRSLKPDDVKWLLMDTAVDLGVSQNTQGMGRIDALAAVRAAQAVLSSGPEPLSASQPNSEPKPDAKPASDPEASASNTGSSAQPSLGCFGSLLHLFGII
ncbi:MAG: S8 family peptidase [Caldilineaceae bacterium]|nr:S8 family peptidase [Caldilineaceae bacterium]